MSKEGNWWEQLNPSYDWEKLYAQYPDIDWEELYNSLPPQILGVEEDVR